MAYALVGLGPVLGWLAWISWSDEKASDAMHVVWFVTVAATCVLAGGLAPRKSTHLTALAVTAIIATMATLFLWWSTGDSNGLFMIGIVLATPMVSLAAPILLLEGITYDDEDRPVESFKAIYRADRLKFALESRRESVGEANASPLMSVVLI